MVIRLVTDSNFEEIVEKDYGTMEFSMEATMGAMQVTLKCADMEWKVVARVIDGDKV